MTHAPLTPEMVAKAIRRSNDPRWRVTALSRERKVGYFSGLVIKGPSDHLEFVLVFDRRPNWPMNGRMPNTFHVRRKALPALDGVDARRNRRMYDYTHYLEMVRKVACRLFKLVGDAHPDWVEHRNLNPSNTALLFNSQGFVHLLPDVDSVDYATVEPDVEQELEMVDAPVQTDLEDFL